VGLYHLAWEVDTLAELDRLAGALSEAGALVGASDHSTTKSLYARDPDGLEFEGAWVVPADRLDDAVIDGRKGIRPLDLEREKQRYGALSSCAPAFCGLQSSCDAWSCAPRSSCDAPAYAASSSCALCSFWPSICERPVCAPWFGVCACVPSLFCDRQSSSLPPPAPPITITMGRLSIPSTRFQHVNAHYNARSTCY
jgi:hypothetical protein